MIARNHLLPGRGERVLCSSLPLTPECSTTSEIEIGGNCARLWQISMSWNAVVPISQWWQNNNPRTRSGMRYALRSPHKSDSCVWRFRYRVCPRQMTQAQTRMNRAQRVAKMKKIACQSPEIAVDAKALRSAATHRCGKAGGKKALQAVSMASTRIMNIAYAVRMCPDRAAQHISVHGAEPHTCLRCRWLAALSLGLSCHHPPHSICFLSSQLYVARTTTYRPVRSKSLDFFLNPHT